MYGLSGYFSNSGDIAPRIPMRTAGTLFLVLGLINLFNEASQSVHAIISTSSIAYILCLLIGVLLLLRIRTIIPFARFAVIAGIVLQGGYLLINGLFLDFM